MKAFYGKFRGLYVLTALLFIAWGRWESIIFPWPLNPDEAQAAANTLRIKQYGISWNAIDGTTAGPLNSLIISWPHFFGVDVTLSTVRLTALLLLSIIFVFTYLSIKSISGSLFAFLFSAPLAIFHGLTRHFEFLHYSSELLSLSMLVLATYILFEIVKNQRGHNRQSKIQIILLGLAVGAVPFSKLQATPIAFVIGACSLCFLLRSPIRGRKTITFIYIGSCLIPCLALVAPLIVSGDFQHFYNSYLLWGTIYIQEPLSASALYKLVAVDPLFQSIVYFSLSLGVVFLGVRFSLDEKPGFLMLYLIALLSATVFSIVRPGYSHLHYLMFLPPFLLLFVSYLGSAIHLKEPHKYIFGFICTMIAMFFIYPALIDALKQESLRKYKTNQKYSFSWKSPGIFAFLLPKSTDRLFIWGWMPHWYILSGLTPATRESMTNNQIADTKLQQYFRKRLIGDLNASNPDFIIDSVAGNSYRFNKAKIQGIISFPELHSILTKEFVRLGNLKNQNPSCAKIYAKKDKASKLSSQFIDFKSISSSAERPDIYPSKNIDDYSVTEDTCADYWLLPDGLLGHLDVKFNAVDRVKRLLILNTRNGYSMNHHNRNGYSMNHSTDKVKITLSNKSNNVTSINLKMSPYPLWTEVVLEKPIDADSLKIDIISFRGNGGGLNEVKAIREPR